jgi:signal transduction histidine kinase
VRFTVRDHGPGVPDDQMKKIFRLFYRTESELTRETVGTGIGLALVHQLVLAMQGSVDVRNRDPGAEFRVTLTRTAARDLV